MKFQGDIAITSTSFGKVSQEPEAILTQAGFTPRYVPGPLSGEELVQALSGAVAAIIGTDPLTASDLEQLPDLKVLVRHGAGLDNVPLQAAFERGIRVANVPGASTNAVAELAVALMLALARHVPEAERSVRRGAWPRLIGTELGGKTCGIVGFGKIGQAVASRLSGFEMRLLTYDPYIDPDQAQALGARLVPLDELLASSDFVTLHLPLTAKTRHIIGRREISLMKPGAYLINTARGGLVDEEALAGALNQGRLAGAAIDVFAKEPPDPSNPLLTCERVLPTPHMGAYTTDALNQVSLRAAKNAVALLLGEPCPDEITMEALT